MSVPSSTTGPHLVAPSTAEEILKGIGSYARSAAYTASSYASSYSSRYLTSENGNYTLSVLFYIVLYSFILFLILVIVHFSITPVFKFTPGAKGLVGVPSSTDDIVYWNKKSQPSAEIVPTVNDSISTYDFMRNFSFSVDIFLRKITDADINKQIFLYLAYEPPTDTTVANVNLITNTDFAPVAGVEQTTQAVLVKKSYMGMYLTDTNDLIVTFVSQGTPYSTRPIKNIPFYTPFRITVVVEDKSFSVFINGQQAFQRIVPGVLTFSRPAQTPTTSKLLKFYPPPFGPPIYVQNLHLWPRAISYKEVQRAQPALALESDFGSMPTESVSGTCS